MGGQICGEAQRKSVRRRESETETGKRERKDIEAQKAIARQRGAREPESAEKEKHIGSERYRDGGMFTTKDQIL